MAHTAYDKNRSLRAGNASEKMENPRAPKVTPVAHARSDGLGLINFTSSDTGGAIDDEIPPTDRIGIGARWQPRIFASPVGWLE